MESLRYHALFGLATSAAGCAARDVDFSQRGPIPGEATIQGDRTITESEQSKKKSSRRKRKWECEWQRQRTLAFTRVIRGSAAIRIDCLILPVCFPSARPTVTFEVNSLRWQ